MEIEGLYFKYIIVHLQPDFIQIEDCITNLYNRLKFN
jgi:hypothetical protein